MNGAPDQLDSSRYYKMCASLMWLVLPALALQYALAWNQLPSRLATHFDLNNRPNGWMSREGSLIFSLVFAVLVIATASWISLRVRKPDATAWSLLALFYVVLGTLFWAENSLIAFNLSGRPVNVVPVLIIGMGAALLVMIVALTSRRGPQLSVNETFAEESHRSVFFGLVLFAAALGMVVFTYHIPAPGPKIVVGLGALLILAAALMACSGFQYRFGSHGLEIRMFGLRLRSIPANHIQNYAIDRWKAIGGYGIRGVGEKRAYVWGSTGVRIETSDGEVFLGYGEPAKLLHDLDLMTSRATTNHPGHETTKRREL